MICLASHASKVIALFAPASVWAQFIISSEGQQLARRGTEPTYLRRIVLIGPVDENVSQPE